ncbi:MAG TPA: hypothetical protein VFB84_07155 [Micromonosporaceae bacterium]|nr:hypothetical protein [Micromonosporaceae bacterium]
MRRSSLAAESSGPLVAGLVELAPDRTDPDLEDELCRRLGACLGKLADGPFEDRVDPSSFAEAALAAAAAAVRAALDEPAAEPDGWRAAWRVLTAAAGIVPFPHSRLAAEMVEELRDLPGGHALPEMPAGPAATSQVLWARDAYGSRFGVTAAFAAPDGPDRWYLWDIDACGYQPVTVHSAYYPTAEQAMAAWVAGVGRRASGEAAFVPVDDPSLLAELMPADEGFLPSGGANADQLAEYHRGMRLAEVAVAAVEPHRAAAQRADLDAATAVKEFTAWLREHRADRRAPSGYPEPADLEDLVEELADSWCFGEPAAIRHTCSPHRVAFTVLHLLNYYQDDFAAKLIALLPDWTSWLAMRNGTAPELAERCQPYALGEPHADVGSDHSRPNDLARVTE